MEVLGRSAVPWHLGTSYGNFLMARERPLRDRTGSRAGARKRGPALQGLEENEPEESWLGECFEDQTWAKWVNFQEGRM